MDHNKDINISKDHIMVMGKVNDKVEAEYVNATSSIKQPPKSTIVT
jgi:hypothetical protein